MQARWATQTPAAPPSVTNPEKLPNPENTNTAPTVDQSPAVSPGNTMPQTSPFPDPGTGQPGLTAPTTSAPQTPQTNGALPPSPLIQEASQMPVALPVETANGLSEVKR